MKAACYLPSRRRMRRTLFAHQRSPPFFGLKPRLSRALAIAANDEPSSRSRRISAKPFCSADQRFPVAPQPVAVVRFADAMTVANLEGKEKGKRGTEKGTEKGQVQFP
jgi:hypothetical protein